MDVSQLKKMRRFRKGFRFVGVMFILVGSFLLFNFIALLLDPESTITVNGIVTSEFKPKLHATLFTGSFVIVGLLALFGPSHFFNKLFVWRQSLVSVFSCKK